MNKFFAVTKGGSLFRITAPELPGFAPEVIKIASREQGPVPIGTKLEPRELLSVGKKLEMFARERYGLMHVPSLRDRNIDLVPTENVGASTEEVAALFSDEARARTVIKHYSDLVPGDKRFTWETKSVIDAIPQHHLYFVVARGQNRGLLHGLFPDY